jgi:ABC-2 type transport system permease protein
VRTVLVIAGKELRTRVAERLLVALVLVAPIVFAVLAGLAFDAIATRLPGARVVRLAVADTDDGRAGRAVAEALDAGELRRVVAVRHVAPNAVRRFVADGTVDAGLTVPAGFTTALAAGEPARLRVDADPAKPVEAATVRALADQLARRASQAGDSTERITRTWLLATFTPRWFTDASVHDRRARALDYFGPSMAIGFLFVAVGISSRSLWSERRLGLLARQLASPLSSWQVVVGTGVGGGLIGAASVAVLWLTTTLLFGARWGPFLPVAGLLLCMLIAAVALMALITGLVRSEERVEALTGLLGFGCALVGGNLVQYYRLPATIRRWSVLTPNGWAMRSIADLAGAPARWGTAGLACAVILGFATAMAVGARITLRRGLLR